MQIATFDVVGISPLLMNNPASMLVKGDEGITTKKKYVTEEEAENSAYRLPSGQLWFPTVAWRSSMWTAAVSRTINKRAARAIIAGSVFTVEEETPLVHPDDGSELKDYEIDIRRVVVGKGKGDAIPRVRARVFPWSASVSFEYDPDFILVEHIREFLNLAGKLVGVGDYRPEKKGGFGRFYVREVQA